MNNHNQNLIHTRNQKLNDDPLLTRKEAAEYLNISEGTLGVWACTKRVNLKIYKIGNAVRYPLSGLKKFLEENTVKTPTSEQSK